MSGTPGLRHHLHAWHWLSLLRSRTGGGAGLAGDQWPDGCLGYAYNLLRPARPGDRAKVLYPLFTGTLVFETLETAHAYKEFMATVR